MNINSEPPASDERGFLAATGDFVSEFGWRLHTFRREEELIALVVLDQESEFEHLLWAYDTTRAFIRCLLVGRNRVPVAREPAILELCARINDGLAFGCAEYSFSDRVIVFRDSFRLSYGKLSDLLPRVSASVMRLGGQYSPAIRATLAGMVPVDAIDLSED